LWDAGKILNKMNLIPIVAIILILVIIFSMINAPESQSDINIQPLIVIGNDGQNIPIENVFSENADGKYILLNDIDARIEIQKSNIYIEGNANTISGFNKQYSSGMIITNLENVTIANLIVQDYYYGMIIQNSQSCNIVNCKFDLNSFGLKIEDSYFSSIINNIASNNDETGIILIDSDSNIIDSNAVFYGRDGMMLYGSSNNTITRNTIIKNDQDGIKIDQRAEFNDISRNDIATNKVGLTIYNSWSNMICLNNIFGNSYSQARVFGSSKENIWDNGEIGNYWGITHASANFEYDIYSEGAKNIDHHPLTNKVNLLT
jgi:parallel beta-helix repeat protein